MHFTVNHWIYPRSYCLGLVALRLGWSSLEASGEEGGGGAGRVFGRFMFCHDLMLVLAEHRHHSMKHLMGRL